MCAPYGRWVVLLRERGRGAFRLIGFAHADGAESAYRSRTDALSPDIDVSVVPPPGYEGCVGEPMVLLPTLRLDFALAEARSLVRDAYSSGRHCGRQRQPLHRSVWCAGVAGRKRRHIRQRNVRRWSFLPAGRRAWLLACS
jgi:hypothetical protein